MQDIQVVYVRDVAELSGIGFGQMLRMENLNISGITGVHVNGVERQHFVSTTPEDKPTPLAGGGFLGVVYAYLPPEYLKGHITDISIIRKETDLSGTVSLLTERVDLQGKPVNFDLPTGSNSVTVDGAVLSLRGKGFSKALSVRVNSREQQFIIVNDTSILSMVPSNIASIDAVDVIVTAQAINRTSFFEYILGSTPQAIGGPFKLVQQFVKLLLTTPDTDIFRPMYGGNFQNWVGMNIPMNVPQVLVAKTTMNVIQAGISLQTGQVGTNIPGDERLADVQILNMSIDPLDPSVMEMSLKLNTFSSRTAFFSLLIQHTQNALSEKLGSSLSHTGASIDF